MKERDSEKATTMLIMVAGIGDVVVGREINFPLLVYLGIAVFFSAMIIMAIEGCRDIARGKEKESSDGQEKS